MMPWYPEIVSACTLDSLLAVKVLPEKVFTWHLEWHVKES